MKENIDNLLKYLKNQNWRACITGSVFLDYFEDQDIDVFAYDERSITNIIYTLLNNKMFQLIDPI